MANNYKIMPITEETGQRIADALETIAGSTKHQVYGFELDTNESDPDAAVTYIEDAVGLTPARMDFTNGKFDYGSWRNAFFMPKPCMLKFDGTVAYYLDENDYTKKADGTASDIADVNYGGNVMMEWPKIWYKIVPGEDGSKCRVFFSDVQKDLDYKDYCYINKSGIHVDHFYTPVYTGNPDSSGKMRSLSGQTNIANNQNTTTQLNECQANGDGWDLESFSERQLINLLLILISKNWNSQSVFGNGLILGDEESAKAYITGSLDKNGMFFGYNDQTHAVKVFGMENWWGLFWHRTQGIIGLNGKVLYKMCYGREDGSATDAYNTSGDGYIDDGVTMPEYNNYQSQQNCLNNCILPKLASGTSATYNGDYYYISKNGTFYGLYGGRAGSGTSAGAWYLSLNGGPGSVNWNTAGSPSFKPLS